MTITTTASETNGTISNISLYNGSGVLLGFSSTSPFNYVYSNILAGSYSFYAVAKDVNGISITSSVAAVTVTAPIVPVVPPVAAALPVVSITSPVNNMSFTVPASIVLTANASESGATIARVDYYAGTIYLGEATSSPYTVYWNSALAGAYSLTAKATDSNGATSFSAPISITVNPHTPPIVSLVTPINNASYLAPASIILSANASVTGGTITKVDFYSGTLYLGTAYASPYNFTWSSSQTGTYSITAKATDSTGVATTSSAVNVAIATASLPVVAITSPTNGSSLTAGSAISITANASEANGTISQVQFYNGSTLLGTSSKPPFSYNWSSVPAGTYVLTARAMDAKGVSTVSSIVTVTVTTTTRTHRRG